MKKSQASYMVSKTAVCPVQRRNSLQIHRPHLTSKVGDIARGLKTCRITNAAQRVRKPCSRPARGKLTGIRAKPREDDLRRQPAAFCSSLKHGFAMAKALTEESKFWENVLWPRAQIGLTATNNNDDNESIMEMAAAYLQH